MKFTSEIKTVEDAFKYLGIDTSVLAAFQSLPEEHRAYMEASYKRLVVIEALNKEANAGAKWIPNWGDHNEYKYCSWVWLKPNPAGGGFVLADTTCDYTATTSHSVVGSRLCLKSAAMVHYLNEQFADLIQIVMAE